MAHGCPGDVLGGLGCWAGKRRANGVRPKLAEYRPSVSGFCGYMGSGWGRHRFSFFAGWGMATACQWRGKTGGNHEKKILSSDIELIGSIYLWLGVMDSDNSTISASIALARNWDMNMKLLRSVLFMIIGAMVVPVLAGCGNKPPAAMAPPPAGVTVAHPVSRAVVEWDTYTGHLESPELVNLEARVSGLIVSAPFVEGSIVKKGELLYEIDERPFKADLDARLADEQKAQAAQENAKLTYDRLKALEDGKAVSQQDVDDARGNYDQAVAAVAAAKAGIESSRLNLEWCRVTSPIDGRISNKLVNVGNLVNGGQGEATLLTTVVSVSPIYCYVDIDELSVLKYQKLVEEKKRVSSRDGRLPCRVQLSDEAGYPYSGYIDFEDNHVDSTTGTLRVRGVLENKDGLLTPGFLRGCAFRGVRGIRRCWCRIRRSGTIRISIWCWW